MQSAGGAESPTFTDDDLRYRQLTKREQPAMQAVVILLLDVSGSMGERERQISKTFFFWAIQGLRRQYRHLELVFVAHTSEAWEFQEEEFFRVTGTGGTVASAGLKKVLVEEPRIALAMLSTMADRVAELDRKIY